MKLKLMETHQNNWKKWKKNTYIKVVLSKQTI